MMKNETFSMNFKDYAHTYLVIKIHFAALDF